MAKLFFRYAAMNAGKSSALLQVAFNYEERGMKAQLFSPAVDTRAGEGVIASRIGLSHAAQGVGPNTTFGELIDADCACVLVDEAQFLSAEQARELHQLAHERGVPVICYGLRTDFRGKAFPGSAELLAIADELEEMKTICQCSKKATMNARFEKDGTRTEEGEQVDIGGNERYRSMCAGCFYKKAPLRASQAR